MPQDHRQRLRVPPRLAIATLGGLLGGVCSTQAGANVPMYGYEVVHVYPHDRGAFTEGLFYLNGYLYESTGLVGQSSIRQVELTTGRVLKKIDVPAPYFGEGIVNWKTHLVSLTWQSHVGFVYDLATFRRERQFEYAGEGWALTQNGAQIFMSDGTPQIRLLNPSTLLPSGVITVRLEDREISRINELEWVKGEIYANVWQTNWILRIDPHDGHVVGLADMTGLLAPADIVPGDTDVLNGIAYDARHDRLFVTGKKWPKLFEVRLVRKGEAVR